MNENKGTTVEDRREDSRDEAAPGGAGKRREAPEDALKREDFFTGLTFSALILSLSTSALVNLGELPDPLSNEKGINLVLAKQTIGIVEMLKEKTKGNLSADEDRLINNMLYDLRIKYVGTAKTK
jgi:Domain of unknown function (DUF1844)